MGSCCSCQVSIIDKVHDVGFNECKTKDLESTCENGEGQVMLKGSSKCVSMYSQKGTKGVNQDGMTVWEDFGGEKDTIFCSVLDGHGPLGHKFSTHIRDKLPSKLATTFKMSQQNVSKDNGSNATKKSINGDSWEEHFFSSFNDMDQDLAKNIDTDGFSGGSTAITLIKKGDQLIIGNLGDSRAVLCTKADDNNRVPIQLTVDLNPDVPSEANRVIKCGGRVFPAQEDPDVNRIWLPEGDCPGLAMTRAFGDFCLKKYGLSSVPEMFYRKLSKKDEFVVLATDGIWNVLSNNEVITLVALAPKRSLAAKLIVRRAVQVWKQKFPRYHIDDCSVICLFFDDDHSVSVGGKKRHR
ncbi:probable protein phosphatase 2C 65 [Vicia villosa]|uniref:probable protein phosphatase 2C 65 n=1 Tax=Vicia villosa TaxID=3911 RepID=UPI00273A9F6D|nr:probable protein phosphatase 2C 65 [Vicia villosa]